MSDDVIKVHDLPGIEQYSESISQFSKALDTATNDTARTFNNKIEGSEGIAISSFLQSLNDLQTQIFDKIPEALGNYAKIVEGFSSSVSGIGFGKEAWTSESGNSDVRTKLTGDQKDSVLTVDKNLQTALDTAAKVLGEGAIDISNITNDATNGLQDAATARLNTHTPFQAAHDTFNTNLQQVIGTISALKGTVGQAQITLNFSPKAVFNMIAQGVYVNPVTGLQNSDEAIALDSVYGDNQKQITKANAENVRMEIKYIMATGIALWISNEDTKKLDDFFGPFGEMSYADSQRWLDDINTAAIAVGVSHQNEMLDAYYANDSDYKKMDFALFKKEDSINILIRLTDDLYKTKFSRKFYTPPGTNEKIDDPQIIKFGFQDKDLVYYTRGSVSGIEAVDYPGWDTIGKKPEDGVGFRKRVISIAPGNNSARAQEAVSRIQTIDQEKQQAVAELLRDLAIGTMMVCSPSASTGLGFARALTTSDASSIITAYPEGNKGYKLGAASIAKIATTFDKLNEKEAKEIKVLKDALIGKGGTVLDDRKKGTLSGSGFYRLEGTLRLAELNDKGVSGMLNEEQMNEYKKVIKSRFSNEIVQYVTGDENSKLKLEDMSKEQVIELWEAIKAMDNPLKRGSNGEEFVKYLEQKYPFPVFN